LESIARELRKTILLLSHLCQDGNLQSAFSCQDIIWVLYDKIMRWSPELAQDADRDFFIISKGQATLALYSVLIKKNYFSLDDFENIGSFNGKFSNQVDSTKFSGGIENSAGSLGHGLPFAAGIAFANKIKKSPSRVFVLTGDGEFCEGTMWESCIFAAGKKLDNLCVIIDDNNSACAMIDMGDMEKKLTCFGFDVNSVDGHDLNAIELVLNKSMDSANGRPKAIIAKTIRGYGSPALTENEIWFHKAPDKTELRELSKEIDLF
jgi:transketolase